MLRHSFFEYLSLESFHTRVFTLLVCILLSAVAARRLLLLLTASLYCFHTVSLPNRSLSSLCCCTTVAVAAHRIIVLLPYRLSSNPLSFIQTASDALFIATTILGPDCLPADLLLLQPPSAFPIPCCHLLFAVLPSYRSFFASYRPPTPHPLDPMSDPLSLPTATFRHLPFHHIHHPRSPSTLSVHLHRPPSPY
jgi:hypothetical protein